MKEVRVQIKNGRDITLDKICHCVDNTVYLDAGSKSKIVFSKESLKVINYGDDTKVEIDLGQVSKAHVIHGEHEIDMAIEVKDLVFDRKYIRAVYDTGELIELQIDFL